MRTEPKPLAADRARKLNQWLRRKLRAEAWQQFFESLIFLALGFGLLSLFSLGAIVVAATFLVNVGRIAGVSLVLGVMAAIVGGSYLTRGRAEHYSGKRNGRSAQASILEIVLGAADQLRMGFNCLEKCFRLSRCDVAGVSVILLWLFDRRHKATVQEITTALAGESAIRVLPQLRDISGVIWLTYHHGVIMLSPELRREIGLALNETQKPTATDENARFEEKRAHFEDQASPKTESASAEKIGWYLALNLPPYSPLSLVKKRYRELVKIHHPDLAAGNRRGTQTASDEQIKRINAAYHNILENSKRFKG